MLLLFTFITTIFQSLELLKKAAMLQSSAWFCGTAAARSILDFCDWCSVSCIQCHCGFMPAVNTWCF
jgi:hypothetical protein